MNILKYAPIMGDDAQEIYEEKLDEKSRKTAATVQSITDEILKESMALTTDTSADEVVDATTGSLNLWSSLCVSPAAAVAACLLRRQRRHHRPWPRSRRPR